MKIMASGPTTSWEIDAETVETHCLLEKSTVNQMEMKARVCLPTDWGHSGKPRNKFWRSSVNVDDVLDPAAFSPLVSRAVCCRRASVQAAWPFCCGGLTTVGVLESSLAPGSVAPRSCPEWRLLVSVCKAGFWHSWRSVWRVLVLCWGG